MNTATASHHYRVLSMGANALPAAGMTAALVFIMHSLIATDMTPPEIEERRKIEVIGKVPELSEPVITVKPDKPLVVQAEPVHLSPDMTFADDGLQGDWDHNPRPPLDGDTGPISTGANMVVPYLKLQPTYPPRALKRGIEGHVDLAFDITAAGKTTNIRVIEAEPEGVFERAAIRALEKWKYKVPMSDGTPQGQVDMMTRLSFKLEK